MPEKKMYNIYILFLFCLLSACASVQAAGTRSNHTRLPVTIVFRGNQCFYQQSKPQAQELKDQTQYYAFLKQNSRATIDGIKRNYQVVDFSKNSVVAIWMGKKSTAGYEIVLEKESAEIKDETAILKVNLKQPEADAILAQMLTSPCLLVALPRGGYDVLEIKDQDNNSLAKLSLKNVAPKDP